MNNENELNLSLLVTEESIALARAALTSETSAVTTDAMLCSALRLAIFGVESDLLDEIMQGLNR